VPQRFFGSIYFVKFIVRKYYLGFIFQLQPGILLETWSLTLREEHGV
jgi:hypothetical protein